MKLFHVFWAIFLGLFPMLSSIRLLSRFISFRIFFLHTQIQANTDTDTNTVTAAQMCWRTQNIVIRISEYVTRWKKKNLFSPMKWFSIFSLCQFLHWKFRTTSTLNSFILISSFCLFFDRKKLTKTKNCLILRRSRKNTQIHCIPMGFFYVFRLHKIFVSIRFSSYSVQINFLFHNFSIDFHIIW